MVSSKIRAIGVWVVLGGLALGLFGLLAYTSTATMQASMNTFLTEANTLPYWAKVLLITGLISTCILPTTLAALLLGAIMGYSALGLVLPACGLAILFHYLVFGLLPFSWRRYLFQVPKAQQLATRLEAGGIGTIFLLRLSPVFPFALTNLMLRFFKFNVWQLLVGSLAGILPRTIISVGLGATGGKLLSSTGASPTIVGGVLAVLSIGGLWWVLRGRVSNG